VKALDRTLWRTRFGRCYGTVGGQTTELLLLLLLLLLPDIRCNHSHNTNNESAQQRKQKQKKCKVLENSNSETASSWRKELSIISETEKDSNNGKLKRKKRKIFQKYRVTNAREVAQLTETLEKKVQAKAQRIRRYEKKGRPVQSE
jgi:hypothetical protein